MKHLTRRQIRRLQKTRPFEEILKSLTPEGLAQLEKELPAIARRARYMRLVPGGEKDPPSGDFNL